MLTSDSELGLVMLKTKFILVPSFLIVKRLNARGKVQGTIVLLCYWIRLFK